MNTCLALHIALSATAAVLSGIGVVLAWVLVIGVIVGAWKERRREGR